MPIPDACLSRDGGGGPSGGAGPGSPSVPPSVSPGGPIADPNNSGPADGPLTGYNPGFGTSGTGWPVIMLTAEMKKNLYLQLQDYWCDNDSPSDLTGVDKVTLVSKEWMTAPEIYLEKEASIEDATNGIVKFGFKPKNIKLAGIWPSVVQCFDTEGELIAQYKCYLYVQPNYKTIGQTPPNYTCPVQPHEIRLILMDTCPEANTLLMDLEFSDPEIMFSIIRPIEEWNETPPDLSGNGYSYTQNTFPWRDAWRKAAAGYLLQSSAIRDIRNSLQYNAGGVSVNEYSKGPTYIQLGQQMVAEWRDWMERKKKELNMGLCYGSILSPSFGAPYSPDQTYYW